MEALDLIFGEFKLYRKLRGGIWMTSLSRDATYMRLKNPPDYLFSGRIGTNAIFQSGKIHIKQIEVVEDLEMKDKIELSFAAFKRWMLNNNIDDDYHSSTDKDFKQYWKFLCSEAEKSDRLCVWSIYDARINHTFGTYRTKEEADNFVNEFKSEGYRVIRLVEENVNG